MGGGNSPDDSINSGLVVVMGVCHNVALIGKAFAPQWEALNLSSRASEHRMEGSSGFYPVP